MIFTYSIASIIFTVIWIVVTWLFLARRHLEPIKSREWQFVMISNVITVIHFDYLCAVLDSYLDKTTLDCNSMVSPPPLLSSPFLSNPFFV